jgi:hypothetical protein
MHAPRGPQSYRGTAVVDSILSDSGRVRFVRLRLPVGESTIEIVSNGQRLLPTFELNQIVQVNLLDNVGGIVTLLVVLVPDAAGRLLLADYNFWDVYVSDGTMRDLMGFDLVLTPACMLDSPCSVTPLQFFDATLETESQSWMLPTEQPVDVDVSDSSYTVVWRGGRDEPGPSTGECSHTVLGRAIAFTVMRNGSE